jgi:hypothetical protein
MPDPPACYLSATWPHPCSKCGCYPVLVHIAAGHVGWYCAKCCPGCGPAAKVRSGERA